ncbi:CaiB/BaiF CoA transferase family protein [Nocardia bovistercoris]|uniref:CoA transferase n=1 Tax=Nocardia bovistercoris TaxID=2785916 RepID=A0A931N7S3_9NOCA|nr:CoA transferase [Nocardia bovistercoris]MBH0781043.1 CoA transferase [Nocardia bovistercoris]
MALPLHGIRVLDLTDGLGESCGRYLADLGAEVIRVEPPTGSRSRHATPVVDGISIPFALHNANKLGITVDLDDEGGRDRFRALAATADIVVESLGPGVLEDRGVGANDIRGATPELVWVSITGFGRTGPYRRWVASEPVLYAMSGVLSRSGAPGAEPLLPPPGLVEGTVGVHAAWAALLAYYRRLETGSGESVDLSAYEAMVHGFDPGFGTQGSAAAGRSEDFPRDRPNAAEFYPVFPCKDGQVRICLLARRQWRAMFEWLGAPAEFADPRYDTIPARFAAAARLRPLIEALFAERTQGELVAEGARRGVPVGGVHSLTEVLETEHFAVSGAIVDAEIAAGRRARVPSGYLRIGGERAGIRGRAPELGEHDDSVSMRSVPASAVRGAGRRSPDTAPLDGLRVLDLGVIVFGAELSRQFADYGADVVKIENTNFPDGLRQSKRGAALAASVAWGHRNKRSLGLDLRSPRGAEIFRRLVADADVVLANFKPGTLASMGFSYAALAEINPGIVVSESSAFGDAGPWRTRLGYGPLVRASCGVSALWRYPDNDELLCDGATVYPDHIAAHVTAVGVLASLIERTRTARGAHLEVAQADTALVQLGTQLVVDGLRPGTVRATGNSDPDAAPSGVYACRGEDEWCVVTVREDREWFALCEALDRPDLAADARFATAAGRVADRGEIESVLAAWLREREPGVAAASLQEAGVPAGAMARLPQLLDDPQLSERISFTTIEHPLLLAGLPGVARAAAFTEIADPPVRPAPVAGEQTRSICGELLGMGAEEIDELVRAGVLQPPPSDASTQLAVVAEVRTGTVVDATGVGR